MTRVLATAVLALWVVVNIAIRQGEHKTTARLAPVQGVLLGALLAACIL